MGAVSTPPAELEKLRTIFQKMDVDNSGTLSLAEFRNAMSLRNDIPTEHIENMYRDLDVNSSGEIDYSEFLSATLNSQQESVGGTSLLTAFNMLDDDGDGYIDKEDIHKAFEGNINEAEVEDMLRHSDKSGRVTFQGFKRMMLNEMSRRGRGSVLAEMSISIGRKTESPVAGESSNANAANLGATPGQVLQEGRGAEGVTPAIALLLCTEKSAKAGGRRDSVA